MDQQSEGSRIFKSCYQKLKNQALGLTEKAKQLTIVNDEGYARAGEFLKVVSSMKKEINATFDPIIKKQREAVLVTREQKSKSVDPVLDAEDIVKRSMSNYTTEQDRLRRLEAEKRQLEAQKKHEAEVLARAVEQEKAGNKEDAEMIMEEAEEVPVIVPDQTASKAKGIRVTKTWKYQVINPKAVNSEYFCLDLSKIGKQVRAVGKSAEKMVGGIRVYQETSTSITGR